MRSLLVFVIILGSLPIILAKPQVGILMWSWVSYMNPHRISWGIADNLPLAKIVGFVTIVGWFVSREPKRMPVTGVTVLLVAYTVWISVTTLFAMNPDDAFTKWEQTMKILFMTFMTMFLMVNRERIHALVWVIVVSLGIYGVGGGVHTILTGGQFKVWGPAGTFIGDNNALALALVMIVPLIRYLHLNTSQWYLRWGLAGATGLCLLSIIGSYSRGGFLALATMATLLLLKSRHKLATIAVLVPILAFGFNFVPQQWWDRMETIETYEEDGSAQARLWSWGFGFSVAKDRPIVGGGFNVFWSKDIWFRYKPEAPEDRLGAGAHSIYFEVLGEHGFVGLAIFLSLGLFGLLTGNWVIRHARDRPDLIWASDLASMTQVGLVAYAAAGAFQNLATFDLYYHYLAIMVILKHIVQQARESEAPTVQPSPGAARGALASSR